MKLFEELAVTTSTVIIDTNIKINLLWFYGVLEVNSSFIEETRGIKNKKQFQNYLKKQKMEYGTITMVQYKKLLKGFKVKKRLQKVFRNALSIVLFIDKLVTIKIPTLGKIQMTGCTNEDQAEQCMRILWDLLRKYPQGEETFQLITKDELEPEAKTDLFHINFKTVMTDKVFDLGFHINRQSLDQYVNQNTKFNSLWENSFGYSGCNVKIPFEIDKQQMKIKYMTFENGEWKRYFLTFAEYLEKIPGKERQKLLRKHTNNTFLVFHSGKAIMSGSDLENMKHSYDQFVSMINSGKEYFRVNPQLV